MPTLEISKDRESWTSIINEYDGYDFGHTYDFHSIAEENGEGSPILFNIRNNEDRSVMCWPALRRSVLNTHFFDLTSVYGYSGPLINDKTLEDKSFPIIFDAMKENGVVSLFARMHPLFSDRSLNSNYQGMQIGNIVVIDTKVQNETIKTYRSNHRRDIRKAIRAGVHMVVDEECKDIDEFIKIYYSTMRDLKARNYYFFSKKYFSQLVSAEDFDSKLVFARYDGINIGAILLIRTNNIMHYYLGGVDRDYLQLSPLKPMLAEAHALAIKNNVRYFVLGGGPGGLDDSLIRFKKGFSDLVYPFRVFKKIVEPIAYKKICSMNEIDPDAAEFFPAYRFPE